MQGTIHNIKIRGIRTVVPENRVCNLDYIKKIANRRISKQIELTGIDYRRVSVNGQKASDLATIAAEKLLNDLQWDKKSIDVLIFVTQSPDLSRPGSAFLIHNRLGIGQECLVYDMNMGCSGYIGGLITICNIISNIKGKGLLLAGESNAVCGDNIHRNALLDGDASTATALEYEENDMDWQYWIRSDGSRASKLYTRLDGHGYMDGNAILLFGLSEVANLIKEFMKCRNINMDNIDYFVFHQAQKMIIEGIAEEVKIPKEKVLISCAEYGNTSSASIPLTLCHSLGDTERIGKKRIITCGYGIGLSWGVMLLDVNLDVIYPIIESDYSYQDIKQFV